MEFCPKCKSIIIPKNIKGEILGKCNNCGFTKKIGEKSLIAKEKISKSISKGEGIMESKNLYATYKNKCKKCGYDKAEIIDMGVFISDEDNLILLECGKCGFSERIGRKTS